MFSFSASLLNQAMIIDGRKIAGEIIEGLEKKRKSQRFLAAFFVGENPASEKFLLKKKEVAEKLKIDFRVYRFPETISQDELRKEVVKTTSSKRCGGVIVQLPLPAKINPQYVMNAIPREKDVDVLSERALGAFYAGRNPVFPPAVATVEKILSELDFDVSKRSAAIVGLGTLVGKPVSTWLAGKTKEIFLLDKGSDLSVLKNADLVILGTGEPQLVKPGMLKDDAVVIDFGYGSIAGKVFGDFDAETLKVSASGGEKLSYTPTPGGTGPILVAELFANFFKLLEAKE